MVVSLPMRDGNKLKHHVERSTYTVVSLPMRDGNPRHYEIYQDMEELLAYL